MTRARILLVDDQPIVANAIGKMLEGADDLELHFCEDARAAVATAVALAPTVILQDLMMPGLDGIEVVRALRAEPATRDVPLVVLSSRNDAETKELAFAAGANDYLVKLPDRLELLARLRYHAASHHAHAALIESQRQLELRNAFIRDTFGRYVSDEIVTSLLESPSGLALGGERRRVTILMADLRGFSVLTEDLAPEQVVALLNNHFEEMIEVIADHGGVVDELVGDAILAIFGAPVQRDDDARRAVACALAMQRAVPRVNAKNQAGGLPAIEMGIGVDTGEVVAGNLGSPQRAKYGVVGTHVNTATRMESFTVGGQILISAATRDGVGRGLVVDDELTIALKSARTLVPAFSVIGLGAPEHLHMPPAPPPPALDAPLPARFLLGDGEIAQRGQLVRLRQAECDVHAAVPPPAIGTAVRLEVLDETGGTRWAGLRGFVAEASPDGFRVRFEPISHDVIAFLRRRGEE